MSPRSTKLLLIGDNAEDAELLRADLREVRHLGFTLSHVGRLSEAVERLRQDSFDLILVDLSVPDAHGLETVAGVRNSAWATPIVVLTRLDDEEAALRAMRAGAQDYLIKGQIDSTILVRSMRYAIERKRTETQLQQQRAKQAALHEMNLAITSSLDLHKVLDISLEKVIRAFPRYAATIRLVDSKNGNLWATACRNVDESAWKDVAPSPPGGLAKAVFEARKPVAIVDIVSDPRARRPDFIRRNGLVSYLGIPLMIQDEILGALNLYTRERHNFSDEEIEFFNTLGAQAAIAIHNSQLYERIKTVNERRAALYEINLAITSTLDLSSVLNILLDKIAQMFPRFATIIRLLDSDTGNLAALGFRNLDERAWRKILPLNSKGLTTLVVQTQKPVVCVDVQNDPRARDRAFLRQNGLISYLGIPMIFGNEVLGALSFYSRERYEFKDEEAEFFSTLAGQAAIAIHNSQLYARIKTANDALEKTLKVKSALVGVMAHELKTPIQVIMGTASLLSAGACGKLTDEQEVRVRKIEAGADELLQLIDSALDMARLERGSMPLRREEVCLGALLRELASEFAEPFVTKGIKLEILEPSDSLIMRTDRVRLKEILRNLIENARKYTSEGKVEVSAREDGGNRIEFCVKDTGIGIKQELLPKIFELFYQVDPTLENSRSGSGLGLNIVKRLVELLSGRIQVASEVGKGTTFRFFLPREAARSQAQELS